MIASHKYICEICGTSYDEETYAIECEKLHKNQKCVLCNEPIKFWSLGDGGHDIFFDGVCVNVQPQYGSKFDELKSTILICDNCLEKHNIFNKDRKI